MPSARVLGTRSRPRKKKVAHALPAGITAQAIAAELQTILESLTFQKADKLRDFLTFIVEHAANGRADLITESDIARHVLKRVDFDRNVHSDVRVEAGRLRNKLREYYDEYGRNDAVMITLPKNKSYVPSFKLRSNVNDLTGEALEHYVEGRRLWMKRTPQTLEAATAEFEKASALAPHSAFPYAAIGECYAFKAIWGVPQKLVMPKAKAAALKALEIDPDHAAARGLLGFILSAYEWDWTAAEKEFQKALKSDPRSVDVCCMYSSHLLGVERYDEAVALGKRAQAHEQSPTVVTNSHVAKVMYIAGRFDESIRLLNSMLQENPNFYLSHWYLGLVFLEIGRWDEALEEITAAARQSGDNPLVLSSLGYLYAKRGRGEDARKIIKQLQQHVGPVPTIELATVYGALGDLDQAFHWLDQSVKEKVLYVSWLRVWPLFKPLRDDSRYAAMLQQLNFMPPPLSPGRERSDSPSQTIAS